MTDHLPVALRRRLAAVATAPHLLVCSDYDGTLAPLAEKPDKACLLAGASDLLLALARLPATRVAIISGRARDNLMAHSGLTDPIMLVGSHGAELPGQPPASTELVDQLDRMTEALSPLCATVAGAWIERKPLGMAVHLRGILDADANRLLMAVRDTARQWPAVRLTDGKAVVELSVTNCTKGDAIRRLADQWGTTPRLVFLGDDVTDEYAFAALTMEDVGVKVGPGVSRAAYRVASEAGALSVLDMIFACRSTQGRHRDPDLLMPGNNA